MEKHKRILGFLYIASGTFQIIVMLIASAIVRIVMPVIAEQADTEALWVFEWIVPFLAIISISVIILFSIPSIIAGYGLLSEKKWGLTLALIMGCFKLFSFPVGTALGIYTIWVYTQEGKVPQA